MPPSTGLTPFLGHFRPVRHHRCCPRGRHAVPGALRSPDRERRREPDRRTLGSCPSPRPPPEDLSRHRRDRLHRRPAGARSCSPPGTGCAAWPASPSELRDHPWAGRVEIVRGRRGRRRRRSPPRCAGVDVAYYLVHALGSGPEFEETDRRTAPSVRRAPPARRASAGSSTSAASSPTARGALAAPALARRGRRDPARLRACRPSVLRAAVIIGSGSASFEMLRYLDRAAAGDGHAALGAHPDPADRGPRRAALPGRLRRPAAGRSPRLRHRRPRRPDLRAR